jgi:hypothetical protein
MSLTKAVIQNLSTNDPPDVEVLVNPTEFSISRGANYAEIPIPGATMPLLQYVRGEAQVLTVELFLDRSDDRQSVQDDLAALRNYVNIVPSLHAPPVCMFQWGDTSFTGVVTSLQEKFQLFDPDGNVLRARVTVSFKSYEPIDIQAKSVKTQSPDRYKTRTVREGDRLDLIAADEYGDPTLWRPIAQENNLASPRQLAVGSVLVIPTL